MSDTIAEKISEFVGTPNAHSAA